MGSLYKVDTNIYYFEGDDSYNKILNDLFVKNKVYDFTHKHRLPIKTESGSDVDLELSIYHEDYQMWVNVSYIVEGREFYFDSDKNIEAFDDSDEFQSLISEKIPEYIDAFNNEVKCLLPTDIDCCGDITVYREKFHYEFTLDTYIKYKSVTKPDIVLENLQLTYIPV